MFQLLAMSAKRPTLQKLDDDGETQMDMCTLPAPLYRAPQGMCASASRAHSACSPPADACSPAADIDMPGSTGTGNYWDPPSGEACCGGTY